jgi:hypothetical protein
MRREGLRHVSNPHTLYDLCGGRIEEAQAAEPKRGSRHPGGIEEHERPPGEAGCSPPAFLSRSPPHGIPQGGEELKRGGTGTTQRQRVAGLGFGPCFERLTNPANGSQSAT